MFALASISPGSSQPPRASFLVLARLLALVWLLAGETVHAQPALPGLPTVGPARSTISTDELAAEMKRVDETPNLTPEIKQKALDLYKQALDELRLADDWAAKGASFKAARENAPQELDEVKAQLNAPSTEQTPEATSPSAAQPKSLDQLKQDLTKAETVRVAAQSEKSDLEVKLRYRVDRIDQVRVLDAAAKQRLDDLDKQLEGLPEIMGGAPDPVRQAQRVLLLAQKTKATRERASYEEELPTYEATRELMRAKLDLAIRRLNQAETAERRCKDAVAEAARLDAEAKVRAAKWASALARPEVMPLAKVNESLAKLRESPEGPASLTAAVEKESAKITADRTALQTQFAHVKKVANLTNAIGLLLQKRRDELPDVDFHRQRTRARQAEIVNVKLKLIDFDTRRSELADIDMQVRKFLENLETPVEDEELPNFERAVRDLLEARREFLDALIADYDNYFNALVLDLDQNEQALIRETEGYADYINEHIFWLPSSHPLGQDDLPQTFQALVWFADGQRWLAVAETLWDDAREHPLIDLGLVLAAVAMFFCQRHWRSRLRSINERVARQETLSLWPTIESLVLTTLMALLWPGVLWAVAWRLNAPWESPEFAKCAAFGLQVTSVAWLTTELFRQVCRKKGLGEVHFNWPQPNVAPLRHNLRWLLAVGIPLTFVVAMIHEQENVHHNSSLGRLAFIVGLFCLAIFARRTLLSGLAIVREQAGPEGSALGGWPRLWRLLGVAVPLGFAVIAALGYYYTALQLTWRLQATLWLVLGLLVTHAFLLRWLLVARRTCPRQADVPHEATTDTQTRRLFRSILTVALAIGAWLIWADVLPALKLVDIELWTTSDAVTQKIVPITIGNVALALAVVLMTIIASRNLPGFLEVAWLERLPLDAAARYALTSISRYIITVLGIVAAFRMIGIGWANVQWLAAAMTVGLGFGLQEIFANFVSGIIILIERPMRVGDTVTVGGVTGTVTRIRSRATTITDWDRKELIVPNKEFITGQLVNWTLTDSTIRLSVKIGIAYGSDTALTTRLLLEAAANHPLVLRDPEPTATFTGFGASALDFELHVFLPRLDHLAGVRHHLNMAIDEAFRAAGIEMAFPQQDIHVRSLPASFTFTPAPPATQLGKAA